MSVVQSLWIGSSLSAMERTSIRSFLANGHEAHLYCYEFLDGVPEGAVVRDGREILPESAIFRYRDCGSLSGFANQFRYELLVRRGGWWMDLDIFLLRPLPKLQQCALATELQIVGTTRPNNCAMFCEPGDPLMEYVCERMRAKDSRKVAWCETGPDLLEDVVRELGADEVQLPWTAFCPVPCGRWFDTFLPGRALQFGPETYGVHFWHELWRRAKLDKNEVYGPSSLFETLKRRYAERASHAAVTL